MEQDQSQQVDSNETARTRVGFPEAASKPKKSAWKLLLIIIIVLILLSVAAWFILGRNSRTPIEVEDVTPTAFINEEPTLMPTPTLMEVDKSEVKIQVLNGTGIAGGAGILKTKLEGLGFSGIEVGNASPQNYTDTEVTFSDSVSTSIIDEITSLLEDTYKNVEVNKAKVSGFDIKIITGYPKGYAPSPTNKPASPTPTIKLSVTPTLTISPTLTPTPTL